MLLRAFRTSANLLTKMNMFSFHRKVRTTEVPTQASYLEPFSINYLHDNPGSRRWPKIVGRGPGSGKGYSISDVEKHAGEV